MMRHSTTATSLGMTALSMLSLLGVLGMLGGGTTSAQDRTDTVDWPLHNLDLAGSRFSSLDQINRSNVHTLTPRWLFQHGVIDGVSNQTTPVIVDGIMYATDSRGSVYAVDGHDGHLLWSYDVTELLGGARREGYIFRHRGVTYADGVDLFICECSFLERNSSHHMSYDDIKENLSRLHCKQLILTHMGEDVLNHRKALMVKTAEDGMVLEV